MIEKLRKINNNLIEQNKNNPNNLLRYQLINKILMDEKCFFKIEIEYAYAILRDLGIKEENIKKLYLDLIDPLNY